MWQRRSMENRWNAISLRYECLTQLPEIERSICEALDIEAAVLQRLDLPFRLDVAAYASSHQLNRRRVRRTLKTILRGSIRAMSER